MMPLHILQVTSLPTPQTLVRLWHKAEHHSTQHVAEETVLSAGSAFTNVELPLVEYANRVLGASLPQGQSPADAVEEVTAHFLARGLRCFSWTLNPSAPAEQTEPLIAHFTAQVYRAQGEDILYLQHMPRTIVREIGGLKIIPARASFRHARELAGDQMEALAPEEARQIIESRLLHLDDPHYEELLALRDGQAVAKVGVLAVGEVGRIEPLYVIPSARRQGIGRTMMSRALEICARSLFKHVLLTCNPENAPAQALYATLGFQKIGQCVSYHSPVAQT